MKTIQEIIHARAKKKVDTEIYNFLELVMNDPIGRLLSFRKEGEGREATLECSYLEDVTTNLNEIKEARIEKWERQYSKEFVEKIEGWQK